MKRRPGVSRNLSCFLGALILCVASEASFGQAVTTAFTFQGVLKNSGAPLNGTVDLRFTLWDAGAAGTQIGAPVPVNAATLTDGLITTTLDFGVSAFGGSQRWLQVEVDTTPAGGAGPFVILTPRQPLTAVPYAMFALAGAGQWTPNGSNLNYTAGNVSIGTTTQNGRVTIYPATGGGTQTGLYVRNTDTFNQYSVSNFISDSPSGIAIQASVAAGGGGATGRAISATNTTSTGYAGYFVGRVYCSSYVGIGETQPIWPLVIQSAAGVGADVEVTGTTADAVMGRVTAASGATTGVRGESSSTSGKGVWGRALAATGVTYGGYFESNSTTGRAVRAIAAGDTGSPIAVYATCDSTTGYGIYSSAAQNYFLGSADAEPSGGGLVVVGNVASGNIAIDGNEIMARNNGGTSTLFLNNDGGDVTISPGGTGRLICKVLQITGGADLSEQFDVNAVDVNPEPGMVVVIDPAHPGELVPATSAYDKKVAGVISGAGGVATGMMMGHNGTIADGAHAVALTGRVYCLVDATDAAIEPGDMLTTSATAGHAMKALDADRSHGAVIGKAMSALPRGEMGLVLVLVNLQ